MQLTNIKKKSKSKRSEVKPCLHSATLNDVGDAHRTRPFIDARNPLGDSAAPRRPLRSFSSSRRTYARAADQVACSQARYDRMSSGFSERVQDVTLFIDDSFPSDESRGTKASFGPLSGQLVDMRPRDQQPNSRFAGVNNGGGFNPGGGLIRAGGASWGGCVLPLLHAPTLIQSQFSRGTSWGGRVHDSPPVHLHALTLTVKLRRTSWVWCMVPLLFTFMVCLQP